MPSVGSSNRSFASLLAELPALEATTWPVRQRPLALLAWAAVTALATAGIAYWLHAGLASLALAVLVASGIPSFVPTRFTFQPQGVLVRKGFWKRRVLWYEIDRVERSGGGLLLYCSGERGLGSPLDAFYLHCPPGSQEKFQQALETLRELRFRGSSIVARAERLETVGSAAR
ncbi:MAG TPA: hypothetical protein VGN57_02480 [Pirellulaceae bacterium]|jgi:hypothetical protein|nr:hypothetical protein [Pirellulaceae bacterium]